jgi:hypothetical protein
VKSDLTTEIVTVDLEQALKETSGWYRFE